MSARAANATRVALALSLAAVITFVFLITVPFAGQPLHIDDAIFWDFARTNLEKPFQQHMDDYRLMGEQVSLWRDTHPPLDHMYMSAIMAVTGSEAESTLHLGFMIFPIIAGVSMFYLARRFTRNALLATLIFLATPAVMTLSHTLMADLPMTAMWLAATSLYVYGVDRSDWRLMAGSGTLAALAVFTGYQAIALLVLLPLYALLQGKLTWRTAWPLLIPVVGFGLYAWYSFAQYGELPRFTHAAGLSLKRESLLNRLQGNLLQLGGATVFPFIIAGAFALRKKRYLALLAATSVTAIFGYLYYRQGEYPLSSAVLFAVFLAASFILVYAVLSEVAAGLSSLAKGRACDRDYIYLGVWLLLMLLGIGVLLPHATAKYTLPLIAPLVMLLFRELELSSLKAQQIRQIATAALVLTLASGMIVSLADYRLAQASRDFTQEFSETFQDGGQVWFVGEWGFRHYMEAKGYRYLTSIDSSPRDGDLVVRAEVADWPLAGSVSSRMRLVDVVDEDWEVPVRVMNFSHSAGFYGSYWGDLPYSLADEPVESFEVYRIGP